MADVTPIRAASDSRFNDSLGHPSIEEDEETVPISFRVPKSVLARIDEWVQGAESSIRTRSGFGRKAVEHFLQAIAEHAEDPALKARMADTVKMLAVDNLLGTYEDFYRRVRGYEQRIEDLIFNHARDIHNANYSQFPLDLLASVEAMVKELPEPYAGHLLAYCKKLMPDESEIAAAREELDGTEG